MPLNQEQLEKQGVYEAKAPLTSLLADLDQIGRMTEMAAERKKRHARIGGYTMLGGLILSLVGIPLGIAPLGIIAILAGFVWWIYSFFAGGKLVQHPVRVGVAMARLKMIQEDASAKAQFSLKLALATKPVKLRDQAWTHRKNGKQEFFEEDWFALQGQLLDGTYLNDDIKDLLRKRHFTNPRGKSKTKTRTQFLVNVRLSYPASVYVDARPAEKALHGQIKVGPGAILRAVRVNEKAIVLKAVVREDKEITTTMGMLSVGGSRILNLARKAAARGTSK